MKAVKKNKTYSVLRIIGIIISAGLILYSCYNLFKIYREYNTATATYETLADEYTKGRGGKTDGSDSVALPVVDWEKLRKKNPDVIAWIFSPDTKINYPVTVGRDNAYYLTRLIDGTKNSSGTIFVDQINKPDFSDDNTVLHGHHMKNGGMFASLENYKKQAYFDEHPTMYLLTPEKNYRIELFAGHVRDASVFDCTFADGKAQQAFIDAVRKKSNFKSPVEVAEGDKIITLSTCDYSFDDARYALFGKLVAE